MKKWTRYSIALIASMLLLSACNNFPANKELLAKRDGSAGISLSTKDKKMNFDTDNNLVQLNGLSVKINSDGLENSSRESNSTSNNKNESQKADQLNLSPLSEEETANLLSALPKQVQQPPQPAFAWRTGPTPPSNTELKTMEDWQAGEAPRAPVDHEPLKVLSASPNGKISGVNSLQISFSQDMYALGQQAGELGETHISITPKIKGQFTWLDTRTLRFEAQPGFALATRYHVEISTLLKAHSGKQLKSPHRFDFETPALNLNYHFPDDHPSVSQAPIILLNFSTVADSASLLDKIYLEPQLEQNIEKRIKFRLATEQDFAADPLFKKHHPDTSNPESIAIVPLQILEKGVSYTVYLPAGVKPEIGDIPSEKVEHFSIKVEEDLTFVKIYCGYDDSDKICRPQEPFVTEFNNVLLNDFKDGRRNSMPMSDPFMEFDVALDNAGANNQSDENPQDKRIQVTPAIDGMQVWIVDNKIYIGGNKKPNTRYQISVLGPISDIFGNQYSKTITATFTTSTNDYWGESIIAEQFVVIPATSQPLYSFFTNRIKNISVQIYKVTTDDFNQYFQFADAFYDKHEGYMHTQGSADLSTSNRQPPGKLVYESQLVINNPLEFSSHLLNLDKAFENGLGHAMVVLRADKPRENYDYPDGKIIWIQKTNIGLTSINDSSKALVLASELATGKPLENVNIKVYGQDIHANTGKNGIANLTRKKYQDSLAIIASKSSDSALLPWNGSALWQYQQSDSLLWYVVDDRELYRPGEKIAIKGWLRDYSRQDNGQLSLLNDGDNKENIKVIEYIFSDAQNQEIGKGRTNITGVDGFDIEFTLPKEMELGHCTLKLQVLGTKDEHSHYFRVEEFRRPEFEVVIETTSRLQKTAHNNIQSSAHVGAHIIGQTIDFNLAAKYFSGGSLGNSPVEWNVWSKQGYFTPANRQDYFFGQQKNWWKRSHREYSGEFFPSGHSISGDTDNLGEAKLSFDLSSIDSNSPMILDVQGSVSDVNRQTFTGSNSALIHPSSNYIGIKTKSQFYNVGENLKVESIVTDLDGVLVSGRSIQISISPYGSQFGLQKPVICKLVSSLQPQFCETKMDTSGIYAIEAFAQDDQGRTHLARQYIWVAGEKLPGDDVDGEDIKLIGKTEDLHEGEELRVMLQVPFAPAQVMLNILREGFIESRIISMKTTSELVVFELDKRHSPGFELQIHAVGGGDKPSYATGSQIYEVSPDGDVFDLKISTPNKIVTPGSEIELSIKASNSQGVIADAEIAIFVVDEAVLATADYRLPDPLEVFHQFRGAGISVDELRDHVKIPPTAKELENLGEQMDEMMDSEEMTLSRSKKSKEMRAAPAPTANSGVSVRKNFSALALFSPRTQTNKNGEAKIRFTLPDSLTRYRITAIAAKNSNQFAYSESNITAQLSLMVRPMPPRFSNVGDQFELPVVIQNISDHSIQTDIALRAKNLHSKISQGWRIEVPANGRVEVRFPVEPKLAGIAEGDVIIHGDDRFDAAHFALPIWTPMAQESEAIYGEIDEGVHSYPINFPKNVVPNFGGINIKTSATALNTLGDAYLYLRDYPYSCTEQIASRVLSASALGNLLNELDVANNETEDQRTARLKQDVKSLLSRQKDNGSFGLWSQQSVEHSYASIHVIHALYYAKQQNIEVDHYQLQQSLNYLLNIEKYINQSYSMQAKLVIRAYALYVASLFNDLENGNHQESQPEFDDSQIASTARLLFTEMKPKLETQSLSAVAWLLSALPKGEDFEIIRDQLIGHITNHTDQTTRSAHVGNIYSRDGYTHMASTRKDDALVLGALIAQDKGSEMISKFMRGLMDKRIKGRWNNTQENVFVLLAALKYFNQFEKNAPNFTASTWLGQKFAGSSDFKKRTTATKELMIPESLVESGNQPLTISKQGEGRLYYRIGIDYAINEEQLNARSQGFSVERRYESAENDPEAVRNSDGIWHIKAGALVRVTLTMKVPGQRHYVALVDPLAAGLEALNPSLANTATRPHANSDSEQQLRDYWRRNWFTHQNLRDERAEVFADQLWGGEFEYSYLARATTLGRFIVAPARAEEMYSPETFGRSASDIIVVE